MQNNKDYFDQSLDEIKLLKYINEADPDDEHGMLRLFDYFYYKVNSNCHGTYNATLCCYMSRRQVAKGVSQTMLQEHLFLVCELLRANLYEFQKYNRENGDEPYFTLPHLQRIAQQVRLCCSFSWHAKFVDVKCYLQYVAPVFCMKVKALQHEYAR